MVAYSTLERTDVTFKTINYIYVTICRTVVCVGVPSPITTSATEQELVCPVQLPASGKRIFSRIKALIGWTSTRPDKAREMPPNNACQKCEVDTIYWLRHPPPNIVPHSSNSLGVLHEPAWTWLKLVDSLRKRPWMDGQGPLSCS